MGNAQGDDPLIRIALCGYEGEHDMPGSWDCVEWKARGGYGSQGENRARELLKGAGLFQSTLLKTGAGKTFCMNSQQKGVMYISPVYMHHELRAGCENAGSMDPEMKRSPIKRGLPPKRFTPLRLQPQAETGSPHRQAGHRATERQGDDGFAPREL